MFPDLKWYFVLVAYVITPSLGFCNAYGVGLTDMNMASNYGKVALFVLAAMFGNQNGVVAGLVGCGLIKSMVSISSDLMQDFRTVHLTLTSPQSIGTAIGCVVAPLTFFLFCKAFDVGNPHGEYRAPYAIIYRNMAILGVEGFSALPHHCLQLCHRVFAFAMMANLAPYISPKKIAEWIPLPMANLARDSSPKKIAEWIPLPMANLARDISPKKIAEWIPLPMANLARDISLKKIAEWIP